MTDVHALLEEYIAAHHGGGEADPREWLGASRVATAPFWRDSSTPTWPDGGGGCTR